MAKGTAHPLEGKLVVLTYTDEDYEGTGTGYFVFRVEDGEAVHLIDFLTLPPESYALDEIGWKVALDVIKEAGVTEVFTPIGTRQFMGFEFGWKESDINPAYAYRTEPLDDFDYLFCILEGEGIEVRIFDAETGKIHPYE